jgi:hypothetical protein
VHDVSPSSVTGFRVNVEFQGVVAMDALFAEKFTFVELMPFVVENSVSEHSWGGWVRSSDVVHASDHSVSSMMPRVSYPEVSDTSYSAGRGACASVPVGCTGESHTHLVTGNSDLNICHFSVGKTHRSINTVVSGMTGTGSDVKSVSVREEPNSGDSISSTTAVLSRNGSVHDVSPTTSLVFRVEVEFERVAVRDVFLSEIFASSGLEPLASNDSVSEHTGLGVPAVRVAHVSDISLSSMMPRIGHPEGSDTVYSASRGSYLFEPVGCSRKFHRHVVASNSDLNMSRLSVGELRGINTKVAGGEIAGSDV